MAKAREGEVRQQWFLHVHKDGDRKMVDQPTEGPARVSKSADGLRVVTYTSPGADAESQIYILDSDRVSVVRKLLTDRKDGDK